VTHSPETGEGATLVLVTVAALAFGLLKDIDYLLFFEKSFSSVRPEPVEGRFGLPFEYLTKLGQSPAINACFFLRDHPFICLSLTKASSRVSNSQE